MEHATTSLSPTDYIKNRVEDQINWYNRKSALNKKHYHMLQFCVILCGALIPLLIGYSDNFPAIKYIVGVLGVIIAVAEGLQNLKKYKENWLAYRNAAEALTREKILFQHQIGEFSDEPYDFKTFVFKAEQIMAGENSGWLTMLGKKDRSSAQDSAEGNK